MVVFGPEKFRQKQVNISTEISPPVKLGVRLYVLYRPGSARKVGI